MIGNRMPKAQRQAFSSAKMPPTAGPTSVAIPHIAEISAIARGQSFCSNTRLIMAYESAKISPPPNPCTVRPISITGIDGANAHSIAPAIKNSDATR
ncbi:hypothetical protein D3C72_1933070 [compost metagenome]